MVLEATAGVGNGMVSLADWVDRNRNHCMMYEDIRVPLDVRRKQVQAVCWYPYAIWAANVSSVPGLITCPGQCRGIHSRHPPSHLLCDINIFYRMLKVAYEQTVTAVGIRDFLRWTPPLMGIWHCYKCCVTTL